MRTGHLVLPQVAGGVVAVAARSGVVVVAVQDGGDVGVGVVVVLLLLDPAVGVVVGLLALGLAAAGAGGAVVGVVHDAAQFVVRAHAGQPFGDAAGAVGGFQDAVAGVVAVAPRDLDAVFGLPAAGAVAGGVVGQPYALGPKGDRFIFPSAAGLSRGLNRR